MDSPNSLLVVLNGCEKQRSEEHVKLFSRPRPSLHHETRADPDTRSRRGKTRCKHLLADLCDQPSQAFMSWYKYEDVPLQSCQTRGWIYPGSQLLPSPAPQGAVGHLDKAEIKFKVRSGKGLKFQTHPHAFRVHCFQGSCLSIPPRSLCGLCCHYQEEGEAICSNLGKSRSWKWIVNCGNAAPWL